MRKPLQALLALALLTIAGAALSQESRELFRSQLRDVRDEILKLQGDLKRLNTRERTIEQELQRLRTELQLRQAEYGEARLRTERVQEDLSSAESRLEELSVQQARRDDYLSSRIRQFYMQGEDAGLRRLLAQAEADDQAAAGRYAAFLNEHDSRVLREFRLEAQRLKAEREGLKRTREEMARVEADLAEARDRLKLSERNRARGLRAIRGDKQRRRLALEELSQTATLLADRLESVSSGGEAGALDPRKFKGLMEWPASGKVTAGFGTQVHPRFKTRVPHPGLDLGSKAGDDIRAVFDGTVVYASWMRGYGLTAIVDHGSELLSIYAHASVLTVEQGETVRKGQLLGKVGETGSLQGPFLYFEMRDKGSPIDPKAWLRRR